ncbi:hypothetical protein LTS12_026657, partial [Elasticomyces elasticus]
MRDEQKNPLRFTDTLTQLLTSSSTLSTGGIDQFISTVPSLTLTTNCTSTTISTRGSNRDFSHKRTDTALPELLDTGSSAWSMDDNV